MKYCQIAKTVLGTVLFGLCSLAYCQKTSSINVPAGSSKVVQSSIRGNDYLDYKVNIRAGQSLSVSLRSQSTSVYFNVLSPKNPGATFVPAMFIGSMGYDHFSNRMVPMDGQHTIRVYQMGAAADEKKTNKFSLTVRVNGKAILPINNPSDAKIPGTPFHARTTAPCKISLEASRKTCEAFVLRRTGGAATVEFRYGSMVRRVLIVGGKPVAHDSPFTMTYERQNDTLILRFGDGPDEEFTISDSLVNGG